MIEMYNSDYESKAINKYIKKIQAVCNSYIQPRVKYEDLLANNILGIYNTETKEITIDHDLFRHNVDLYEETLIHEICHSIVHQNNPQRKDSCNHCYQYSSCNWCKDWLELMRAIYKKNYSDSRTHSMVFNEYVALRKNDA